MEYLLASVALAFAFGVVLWSFREVRRTRLISADLEVALREEIKERDERISNMLKAQADDLRNWWLTARQAKAILQSPPPPSVSAPQLPRERVQHNGILAPMTRQ